MQEIDFEDAFETIADRLPPQIAGRMLPATYVDATRTTAIQLAEPSKAITPVNPADPARIGYPPTLPIELALQTASVGAICEAYSITSEEWELIRHHPAFQADMERAKELVAQEGMSFKLKAKLQAEELLKTSWRTIHDPLTPPSVKADLIKATMRWADLDNPKIDPNNPGGGQSFAIQINFNKP